MEAMLLLVKQAQTCLCYPKDTSHADVSRNFHKFYDDHEFGKREQYNAKNDLDYYIKLLAEKNPNCNFTFASYFRRDEYSLAFQHIVKHLVERRKLS